MSLMNKSLSRLILLTFIVTVIWTLGFFYERHGINSTRIRWHTFQDWDGLFRQKSPLPVKESLSLTEEQCTAVFPGLMKEIDDAVARGPFDFE
jgi:hypothetical protein